MTREAAELAERHGGTWGEHPQHPVTDWVYAVSNDDTRSGYWEWVLVQLESALPPS
jgi:hypothetical protein